MINYKENLTLNVKNMKAIGSAWLFYFNRNMHIAENDKNEIIESCKDKSFEQDLQQSLNFQLLSLTAQL